MSVSRLLKFLDGQLSRRLKWRTKRLFPFFDNQPNANNQVLIEKETIQNLNERPREGLFSNAGVYVSWRKINHRFSLGAVQPRLTDTRLIRTLHYYGQFSLYLGKESPYFFQNWTRLIRAPRSLSMAPLSVRINGVDCTLKTVQQNETKWEDWLKTKRVFIGFEDGPLLE